MNKNEYKEALNKIVISDELREKIINNSLDKKKRIRKKNHSYIRFQKAAGIAACFVFCALSYYAVTNYYHFPANTPTAPTVQTTPNSNNKDIYYGDAEIVTPNTEKKRENKNVSGKKKSEENASLTEIKPDLSDHHKINDSVNTDTSMPETDANTEVQPFVPDAGNLEQNDLPPLLSTSPSDDGSASEGNAVGNGGNVSSGYTSENVSAIEDIERELGYDIKIPKYLPEDYKAEDLSAPFGEFAQITYTNENDKLYYRTAKGSEDISGDYNNYSEIETVVINNNDVTIKGNDNLYHNASWFSDDEAFSIYSDNGIDKDTLTEIVKSVE